jgi:hypothetical protein
MPSRAVAGGKVCLTQVYKTPTPSSGSWSWTASSEFTLCTKERAIHQILVRSTTPTTTFDFTITDSNGVLIRQFLTCTGVTNDVTPTPVTGDFTIAILNASVDEPFTVLLKLRDQPT